MITSCLCAVLLHQLVLLQRVDLVVSDSHFRLRGQRKLDDRLALILVDRRTAEKLNFPLSREHYAVVVNALNDAGAKIIALDYIFDQERPYDRSGDQALAEVTSRYGNIIHAWNAALQKKHRESNFPQKVVPITNALSMSDEQGMYSAKGVISLPYTDLLEASKTLGIISALPDVDGSIRRMPLLVRHNRHIYPSFSLITACRAYDVLPVESGSGKYVLLKGVVLNK